MTTSPLRPRSGWSSSSPVGARAPSSLEPLHGSEAVYEVARTSFHTQLDSRDGLDRVAQLVTDCDVVRLSGGSLATRVRMIAELAGWPEIVAGIERLRLR